MNEHIPIAELLKQQKALAVQIEIGARYQHYKNHHFYTIESLALRENDNSWSVNYRDELSGILFNRRAEIFSEKVPGKDGKMVPRFTKVV